jgi:polyisoprenoid-binding protein YceI
LGTQPDESLLGSLFQNLQELNALFLCIISVDNEVGKIQSAPMKIHLTTFFLLASALLPSVARAEAPVFTITPVNSSITFFVDASVAIKGTFEKWESTLTFTSTDVSTGVLTIKIYAASVNTGSGMKNGKLKGKDFFNAEEDPFITFVSKKIVETGPNNFTVTGDFTIRGVTKPEVLTLTVTGRGTGSGTIKGTMSFNRKDFGMNKGIPFVKISDHVDVTVNLKAKRISGPPVTSKK